MTTKWHTKINRIIMPAFWTCSKAYGWRYTTIKTLVSHQLHNKLHKRYTTISSKISKLFFIEYNLLLNTNQSSAQSEIRTKKVEAESIHMQLTRIVMTSRTWGLKHPKDRQMQQQDIYIYTYMYENILGKQILIEVSKESHKFFTFFFFLF